MNNSTLTICTIVLFLIALPATAQEEQSFSTQKLSDNVLLAKYGTRYFDMASAIRTDKGIVVIDTGMAPSFAKKYREMIEKEFAGEKFLYVINTHFHYDHTFGNSIFPEATVIGSELTRQGIIRIRDNFDRFIESQAARIPGWEERLASLEPDSAAARGLRETIYTYKTMVNDAKGDFTLRPSDLTFTDRMTLDLGNVTLELIYFGDGRHTGDDSIVLCPEEKVLFTGDLFWSGDILVSYKATFDAPRWIEVLNHVLSDEYEIDHIVTTHNGLMTKKQLSIYRDYLVDLWEGLRKAKADGLDFEAVRDGFAHEKKFKYLDGFGLPEEQVRRNHQQSLQTMWRNVHGVKSVMAELRGILSSDGLKAAKARYKGIMSSGNTGYFFDENEINRWGYYYLGKNSLEEALFIFGINVEHHPESWNAYDSLAEACIKIGEKELAIKNYKKSLELNPDNSNGKAMLERLLEEKK